MLRPFSRIALACLALFSVCSLAGADPKTAPGMINEINAYLPTNGNGQISATRLRQVLTDMVGSYEPMRIPTPILSPVYVSTTEQTTLSGLQTIDGVTPPTGSRVLVRYQDNAIENGIYIMTAGAWERSTDLNGVLGLPYQGTMVTVGNGTIYGGNAYYIATQNPVIGVTGITWYALTLPGSGGGGTGVTSVNGMSGAVTLGVADIPGAAPLASPTFTGVASAPTATPGDNSTKIATTAFVAAALSGGGPVTSVNGYTGVVVLGVSDIAGAAPTVSPTFTGTPTAPTQTLSDSSTKLATTAFVKTGAPVLSVAGKTGAVTLTASDSSFTNTGTGATATTVQARLQGLVYAKDYGVTCDGVTDTTTALQNAINAAQDSSTTIGNATRRLSFAGYSADSICVVSSVEINKPFAWYGDTAQPVLIRQKAGTTVPLINIKPSYSTTNWNAVGGLPAEIHLRDITLSSADGCAGSANAHGIYMTDASVNPIQARVILENVRIWGMPGNGIYATGFNGFVEGYKNFLLNNCKSNLVTSGQSDWKWYGGELSTAQEDNLVVNTGVAMHFYGTYIYTAARYNVYVIGNAAVYFDGVYIDLAGQHGLYSDAGGDQARINLNNVTFRWSGQSTNNTYSDVFNASGATAPIYMNAVRFMGSPNPYLSGFLPKYNIEFGSSTANVSLDVNTTFGLGNIGTAGVTDIPNRLTYRAAGQTVTLPFATTSTVAAGATVYLGLYGPTTFGVAGIPSPSTCVVTRLRMAAAAFPGVGQSYTYSVANGGTAVTNILQAVASGAATNTVDSLGASTFLAYQQLYVRIAASAGASVTHHSGVVTWTCY